MADISRPELCIVGAGALGLALARHARLLGAHVVLVDRGAPETGDGPEEALRLAALQASAARIHALRNAAEFGLANAEPKLSVKAIQERALAVAQSAGPAHGNEALAAAGIEVVTGPVRFADAATLVAGDRRMRPRRIILATGGLVRVPAIPGLDQVPFFTPGTILEAVRKLTHLLVIGDTAEAYLLAQVFARLGSQVTLVPQGRALAGFDPEAAAILLARLGHEGVRVVNGGTVRAIVPRAQGTGAVVDLGNGEDEALDLSHILVAAGRSPDLTSLEIDKARLASDPKQAGTVAGPLGQTRNRRIRLVGIAAGIAQWPHALSHGRAVVEQSLFGAPRRLPEPVPHLVATEPGLALVGRAHDGRMRPRQQLLRLGLVENDQARAWGESEGLVKILTDAQGHILGGSVVGPLAGEMAAVLALAMEQRLLLSDLAGLSLPHPSLLTSLVQLGENHRAGQTVSVMERMRRNLRRALPF